MGTRLSLYRRLADATEPEAVSEILTEIEDRFGSLPIAASHLGEATRIRIYGTRLRASSVELRGQRVSVRLGPETPLQAEQVLAASESKGVFKLASGERVVTRVEGESDTTRIHAVVSALRTLCTLAGV